MEIQVGKGPDFIMTRGSSCVFHRSKIIVASTTSQTLNRFISNRSLYFLCREIMSICRGQKFDDVLRGSRFSIVENPRRYELKLQSGTGNLGVWLYLEDALSAQAEASIINFFGDFFGIQKPNK